MSHQDYELCLSQPDPFHPQTDSDPSTGTSSQKEDASCSSKVLPSQFSLPDFPRRGSSKRVPLIQKIINSLEGTALEVEDKKTGGGAFEKVRDLEAQRRLKGLRQWVQEREEESVEQILPEEQLQTLVLLVHQQMECQGKVDLDQKDLVEASKEVNEGKIQPYVRIYAREIAEIVEEWRRREEQNQENEGRRSNEGGKKGEGVAKEVVKEEEIASNVEVRTMNPSLNFVPNPQLLLHYYPSDPFSQLNWVKAGALGAALATPEKAFYCALEKKALTPSFFKDSCSSKKQKKRAFSNDDEVTSKQHCLEVFNKVRNFCDSQPISSSEQKRYLRSVSLAVGDFQDPDASLRGAFHEEGKGIDDIWDEVDIFQISNRNRKKNKQKKKGREEWAPRGAYHQQYENVISVIHNQYKIDTENQLRKQNGGNFKDALKRNMQSYYKVKNLEDYQFLQLLGWNFKDQEPQFCPYSYY